MGRLAVYKFAYFLSILFTIFILGLSIDEIHTRYILVTVMQRYKIHPEIWYQIVPIFSKTVKFREYSNQMKTSANN